MIIAVSACLLGTPCRYDGAARPNAAVQELRKRHEIVPVCPESMGGLPIPRLPNEIAVGADGTRVIDSAGVDNTAAFVAGAQAALERARRAGCAAAVLKSKSPSCGSVRIYDGTFTGMLTDGWGVAAALFRDAGIPVVDEDHRPAVLGQGGREEDRTSARIARIAQQFDRDVFG